MEGKEVSYPRPRLKLARAEGWDAGKQEGHKHFENGKKARQNRTEHNRTEQKINPSGTRRNRRGCLLSFFSTRYCPTVICGSGKKQHRDGAKPHFLSTVTISA